MSENKNQIIIDVPDGYERCELKYATHVLVGTGFLLWMDENNFNQVVYKDVVTGKYINVVYKDVVTGKYINIDKKAITAYIRCIPKPEPLRVVLEDCRVLQSTGYPEGRGPVKLIVECDGRLDANFAGKQCRVTIEDVNEGKPE
jgi:hypothetical protein